MDISKAVKSGAETFAKDVASQVTGSPDIDENEQEGQDIARMKDEEGIASKKRLIALDEELARLREERKTEKNFWKEGQSIQMGDGIVPEETTESIEPEINKPLPPSTPQPKMGEQLKNKG